MTYEGKIQVCQVDSPWGASQSPRQPRQIIPIDYKVIIPRGKRQQSLAQCATPGLRNSGPHRNKLKCVCFKILDVSHLASAVNLIYLGGGNLTQGTAYSGWACEYIRGWGGRFS